jgi:signal transduction histidine kinase
VKFKLDENPPVSAASSIEVTAASGALRLHVSNDGLTQPPATPQLAPAQPDATSGLANLRARVHAAGGKLTIHRAGTSFDLAAEIPLHGTAPEPAAGSRRLAAG